MKRYRVHHATTVQSNLDWVAAEIMTDFSFPWEPRTPSPTEFRALWTRERFHFRFDCVDDDLVLAAASTSKDRVLGSDRVEIFLAPDLTLTSYFCFEMEPRGEVLAYSGRFHRQFDWDWQCRELKLATHINGARYHVEASLPLCSLRAWNVLQPGATEFFAGVYRAEFSRCADGGIHSGWMPWVNPKTERPDFHVPASFGVFELFPPQLISSGIGLP
jgi:Carbohydrate family 9 binding domain-like